LRLAAKRSIGLLGRGLLLQLLLEHLDIPIEVFHDGFLGLSLATGPRADGIGRLLGVLGLLIKFVLLLNLSGRPRVFFLTWLLHMFSILINQPPIFK